MHSESAGLRVWFDEFELQLGDSLNEKISHGLSRSRFGVVVISQIFFAKHWTKFEMDGLVARQMSGERVILPIWHRITKSEILKQAPSMADIVSLNSSTQGLEEIVDQIVNRVGVTKSLDDPPQTFRGEVPDTGRGFAVFYIAPAGTPELSRGEKPERSSFGFEFPPSGWISVVQGDEELEYVLEARTLRVRLDWRNQWTGDEYLAHQLMSGDVPFALTIRTNAGDQLYFPSAINDSPSAWPGDSSRSGWMIFQLQQ